MELFCQKCGGYLGPAVYQCPECGWQREPHIQFPDKGKSVWAEPIRLEGHPLERPVASHQLILVAWKKGKNAGGLSAFNLCGGLQWQIIFDKAPLGGILVENDRIYLATTGLLEGGSVYCCKVDTLQRNGEIIWQQNDPELFKAKINGRPILKGNRLYIPGKDGTITCLDAARKEAIPGWRCQVGRDPKWMMLADSALLAVCGESGLIYLVDPIRGGQDLPIIALNTRLTCEPLLWKRHLYACTEDGRVLKVDITRRTAVEFAKGLQKIAAPLIAKNNIIIGGSQNHCVYAWDENGKQVWHIDAICEHAICSSPAATDEVVALGANDGKLYGLDFESGEVLWEYETELGHGVLRDVLYHAGVFYCGGYRSDEESGLLYALPWHLGHYEAMAAKMLRQGSDAEAAHLYAVASFYTKRKEECSHLHRLAAEHWLNDGQPHRAAAFWENLADFDQAARCWREAADLMRGRDNLKAAEYYYRAGRLFWRIGASSDEELCAGRAADLAKWPRLRIIEKNNPLQVVGKPGLLTVRVENSGASAAEHIHFDVGGSLLEPIGFTLVSALLPNTHCDFSFQITPTRAEDTVKIEASYFAAGREFPFRAAIEVKVESQKVTHIKLGDMALGEVKIFAENGQALDIETGDIVRSKIEISMAKS